MANTIRIKPHTHQALKEITRATGESLQQALETAVEERRRRVYLEGLGRDYEALRRDQEGSAEFDREVAAWDRASADALEDL